MFGPGGSNGWTAAGVYTIEKDPRVGDVLCVPSDKTLILEGQTRYAGDREYRAMVRFRTAAPSAAIYFTFARRDATPTAKAANFQLVVSATKSPETINTSVSQDNAALFDLKDYEAKLGLDRFRSIIRSDALVQAPRGGPVHAGLARGVPGAG